MSKRILSFSLAIFVLIAALPFGTFVAEETVPLQSTGSVAAEITLTEPDFPEKVTTFKLANNFPTEADTFRAVSVGDAKVSSTDWDPGVTEDPSSYASVSGGTTTISDGWVTFTEGAEKNTFTTQIVFKSVPNEDTNYVAIDVDASGIVDSTKNMTARLYMGMSSGSNTMYATAGQAYYFLPAATEDNPNPQMETRTMSSSSNNYSATFYVKPGAKGTYFFPETLFLVSNDIASYNNTGADWVTNGVGDFSKYMTADTWRLSHASGKYKSNCIYFQFRSCIPANNSIAFSNVRWMGENAFKLAYNAEYIAEDFSDAETTSYTYWNDGHKMTAENFTVADGVWKHNITAENWNDEASTFRYGHTVDLGYPANGAFEALQFDVDFTDISVEPTIQMIYNVKNTKVSTSNYVRRFVVAVDEIYAVWENGVVETITAQNKEWAWVSLPKGFKGTVIIPFESLKTMTVGGYTYDGTTVDLFKNDDVDDYELTIDMMNIPYSDKGDVITYDNYGYITTLKPTLENGTTFNAATPIEVDKRISEEIKTVDAWVKIPAGTAEGIILAEKYRKSGTSSFVLKMNASGNPVLYMCDGVGNQITFEVADVDLRTDKWTHIAFARTETAINCYINGMLKATTEVPEGFAEVKPYHPFTIGHYINSELASATFGGEVANLKFWSKALTSSEILNSAINEAVNEDGLISAWTLNGENGFTDIAGNYNLEVYELLITSEDKDYAEFSGIPENGYTFAVIPDTQIAAQREAIDEVGTYTSFSGMYDWIVENKDTQNIKFVMGLGDITNKDRAEEYTLAKSNSDKLTQAGIPWSIVGGNHDFAGGSVAPNNTTNLNTYFPASELSTLAGFGGFMEAGKIDNSYYYVTVNETKYLILNLMCEPYDSVLEWAGQVCMKNRDCKVIVLTHEYVTNDAKFHNNPYTGRNSGLEVWEKFVSQHENIIMALGGHVSVPDIQYNEMQGVHGNKIINVLADAQALDWDKPSYNMLLLLKFSADGSQVTFDYYSPTQDAFLDANNHFTLDVDGVLSDEALPEAEKADYTYSKFYDGEIIRDYEWFVNDGTKLSNWSDTKHSTVGTSNFSWYNNMVKFTAAANFKVNPDTVTEENPDGNEYTYDRIGLTFGKLPNVTKESQTAISFYIDNSSATEAAGLRIRYNNGGQAFRTNTGSVIYLIDVNGSVTKKNCSGTHSSVSIPKGFKGSVVVPFTSFQFDDGSGNFATAADMLKETQSNNAHLVLYILEARQGYEYLFNNITYLDEYHADDMVTIRNGILGNENGKLIDVTADTVVDARDIVRLKKVLADFYLK